MKIKIVQNGMESQAVVNYCLSQPDLDEWYIKAERAENLAKAISELTPTQRHRLYLLAEGKTIRQIARLERCEYTLKQQKEIILKSSSDAEHLSAA